MILNIWINNSLSFWILFVYVGPVWTWTIWGYFTLIVHYHIKACPSGTYVVDIAVCTDTEIFKKYFFYNLS